MDDWQIVRRQRGGFLAAGLLLLLLFGNWFTDQTEWYGCVWHLSETVPADGWTAVCAPFAGLCAALLAIALLCAWNDEGDCLSAMAGGAGLLLVLLCTLAALLEKAVFLTAVPYVFALLSGWLLLRRFRNNEKPPARQSRTGGGAEGSVKGEQGRKTGVLCKGDGVVEHHEIGDAAALDQ